jgi:2,4-dienoyl-CoA reductase-like NADH-dependent reductase (Old Yellow Enzyme family)
MAVCNSIATTSVAFIFVREIEAEDSLLGESKCRFGGTVIANELMSRDDGERLIEAGVADALAFGRDYIATPDLAERMRQGLPFNTPDKDRFYGDGPAAYTDYPRIIPS